MIWLKVLEPNVPGIRAYTTAGFKPAGRLRRSGYWLGKPCDELIMTRFPRTTRTVSFQRMSTRHSAQAGCSPTRRPSKASRKEPGPRRGAARATSSKAKQPGRALRLAMGLRGRVRGRLAHARVAGQQLTFQGMLAALRPRCPPYPAVGRSGRTQPPCGRDRSRCRESVGSGASGPAVAALAPACRARQYAAACCRRLRRAPQPRTEARTDGSDQRTHRFERRQPPAPPPGNTSPPPRASPAGNRSAGPAASAAYHHTSAGYQQVSLSVTASV
jgi:hypothetical protein